MTNMSKSDLEFNPDTTVDARHSDGPVTLVKLSTAIKSVPIGTVIAVLTSEDQAEKNLRSFCWSTKNEYIGSDENNGCRIHWVKKTYAKPTCATCSSIRTLASGVATFVVLGITAPEVIIGGSSATSTILFVLALCALPPVVYDNYKLVIKSVKQLAQSETDLE